MADSFSRDGEAFLSRMKKFKEVNFLQNEIQSPNLIFFGLMFHVRRHLTGVPIRLPMHGHPLSVLFPSLLSTNSFLNQIRTNTEQNILIELEVGDCVWKTVQK